MTWFWIFFLVTFVLAALAIGLYILLTILIRKSTLPAHLDLSDYKLDLVRSPPHELVLKRVEKSMVIMMVVKNVAHVLPLTFMRINLLAERFSECYVCIYEDNSTDATAQLVRTWCTDDPEHRYCLTETFEQEASLNRIEKIARARQKCLDLWRGTHITTDLILIADADLTGWMNIDGFLTNFTRYDEWDIVWPRGYNSSELMGKRYYYRLFGIHNRMYDGLAYMETAEDKPMQLGQPTTKNKVRLEPPEPEEDFLFPLYSAFNGFGLYKGHLLSGFTYQVPEGTKICEHVFNHRSLHSVPQKSFINRYWCALR